MEHTKRLVELTNKFEEFMKKSEKVETINEADKLKLDLVNLWKELVRQTNRVYQEMLTTTRTTRGRVVEAGFKRTQEWVRKTTQEAISVATERADEPKPKDESKPKRGKKAKK